MQRAERERGLFESLPGEVKVLNTAHMGPDKYKCKLREERRRSEFRFFFITDCFKWSFIKMHFSEQLHDSDALRPNKTFGISCIYCTATVMKHLLVSSPVSRTETLHIPCEEFI